MSDAPLNLIGGCLCGAVRYEIGGTPQFVAQCYCRDCQKATGTGHTTIVGIQSTDFALTNGTPRTYTSTGDSGGKVHRHFCAQCGSRLFTTGDLPGDIQIIQAGTLDRPELITPTLAIYVKDRIGWDYVDPQLPQFAAMPGPSPDAS